VHDGIRPAGEHRRPERLESAVVRGVEREFDLGDLGGHRGDVVPERHVAE
jgi:hypothetical protein